MDEFIPVEIIIYEVKMLNNIFFLSNYFVLLLPIPSIIF